MNSQRVTRLRVTMREAGSRKSLQRSRLINSMMQKVLPEIRVNCRESLYGAIFRLTFRFASGLCTRFEKSSVSESTRRWENFNLIRICVRSVVESSWVGSQRFLNDAK